MLVVLAVFMCGGAGGVATGAQASTMAAVPFLPQGEKLVPSDIRGKESHVGRSVALSADGNTALIGAPRDAGEAGAAWVFVRTGSTWSQQARLEAPRAQGSAFFGRGVALSADGNTALVGDPGHAVRAGAAWVFRRSGGEWAVQSMLLPSDESGPGQFGRSVALTGDGALALVGGFADAQFAGAAWTFAQSGGTWTQEGTKLTPTEAVGEAMFGRGVALSADGTTAAVGGTRDSAGAGSVWTYTRSGGGWEQTGPKLTGAGEVGRGQLGEAVALSGDGSTLVAGAPADELNTGAAWVFVRSGATWAEQGPKLTGGDEVPPAAFGYSVSLSQDGATAIAGGYSDNERMGAAWVFARALGEWTQDGAKLTGAGEVGEGRFGYGVALSGDGSTAMAGGITDAEGVGAVWPFAQPPAEPEPPPAEEGKHGGGETTTTSSTSSLPPAGGVLSSVIVSAPVLGVAGNVQPVSGTVLVRLPHHHNFEVLPGLRQIPFGSVVDATQGRALITVARKKGGTQSGEFFSGEFTLTQGRGGMVVATLTGGQNVACSAKHTRRADVARTRRRRRLWANAHGTFSTKGNYAVGAVQGTEWLTEDTCEGTLIRVTRDKVKVTDLVRHHTTIVKAGHKILIRHP
jgi:hypothetical protein